MTASDHIGDQRRTKKDEGQKKPAVRTGIGTATRQPANLPDEETNYSNRAQQEECTEKRPPRHGTQGGQTRQEKRISQRPTNVINP